MKKLEASSECVSMQLPLAAHPILILLNYFLSGMDVRGKINDTYGHTVGDDAIRTVSRLLSHWVETPDTVIRFAGDEFIVLCVNKTEKDVVALMNTIRQKLCDYNVSGKKPYQWKNSGEK